MPNLMLYYLFNPKCNILQWHVSQYCPLWSSRHENFPVGHPFWNCSCSGTLKRKVLMVCCHDDFKRHGDREGIHIPYKECLVLLPAKVEVWQVQVATHLHPLLHALTSLSKTLTHAQALILFLTSPNGMYYYIVCLGHPDTETSEWVTHPTIALAREHLTIELLRNMLPSRP